MQSMTGYGRGDCEIDGRQMTIELKSVNHRFLDLAFRMPRNLMFVEDAARRALGARLHCKRDRQGPFLEWSGRTRRRDRQRHCISKKRVPEGGWIHENPVLLGPDHHAGRDTASRPAPRFS